MELKLNKETVSLIAGVFGVMGTIWGFFIWVQSGRAEHSPVVRAIETTQMEHEARLDRTDQDRDRFNASIEKLTGKTEGLTIAVEKLTTTIELQNSERKRAENHPIVPLLPSSVGIATERRK
ncbi:MAG: hypothetical protein DI537_13700 [Stutzerimonas stutzeri]|nr:MAG: hypothetical protein DI537_13700 [Stutzerimonas stutzeri]